MEYILWNNRIPCRSCPVRDALPNPTHFALAALKYTSHIAFTITQNVDGLHGKAHQPFMPSKMDQNSVILELHGTLFVS